jgi:stage V sporulation protein G
MEITEVKVFPISEEKLKAFVSVVFDHCFMINDIKIIQGRDGLFISMPSRKKKNGEFKDVAHPLNNETRRRIESQVLAEYQRVLGERGEELPAPPRVPLAEPLAAMTPALAASDDVAAADRVDQASRPVPLSGGGNGAVPEPRAGAGNAPPAANGRGDEEEPTLEEVQELHLRDSFWSVS